VTAKTSRKRLLIGYVCVAVAVAAVASFYGAYRVQDLYVRQISDDLQARARLCAAQMVPLVQADDAQGVDRLCKELGKSVSTRITVIRPNGVVVGDTEEDPQAMENHRERPEISQSLESADGVGSSTRFSTTVEKTLMYVAVAAPKGRSPIAVVRTSLPITTVEERLRGVAHTFFLVGAVTVVLIVVAIPWFSIRLTPAVERGKRPKRRRRDAEAVAPEAAEDESA
jgi:two-component system phosphate regulon sensor histidine kinase PhoR